MPTFSSLPAMPKNVASMPAYITNKKQPLNYSLVVGLRPRCTRKRVKRVFIK